MIKKRIVLPNQRVGEFHVVRHISFLEDGGCIAEVGSFETLDNACRLNGQIWLGRVRCDGVSQSTDSLMQVYGVLAQDGVYGGYEPISQDAVAGSSSPRAPLPEKPQQPTPWHSWDRMKWLWVTTPEALVQAKEFAKARITLSRDAAERSGFVAYGKVFDSEDKAIQRLQGAAQAAAYAKQLGKDFSVEWTCADNSTILLDADMMIEVPIIMTQTADYLHQKARALKKQIESAESIEAIESIVW